MFVKVIVLIVCIAQLCYTWTEAVTHEEFEERRNYYPQELIRNYSTKLDRVAVRYVYSDNPEVFKLNEIARPKILAHVARYLNRSGRGNDENVNITVTESNSFVAGEGSVL